MDDDRRDSWPLPLAVPPELAFISGRGAVVLVPIDSGEQSFLEVRGPEAAGLDVRVTRAGDVVRADVVGGRYRRSEERGETTVVLHVPHDIRARLDTEAGSIEARDLGPCELSVRTGAGRIAFSDVYGRLRVSAGAGQIAAHGLAGSLDIQSHAGAILLQIVSLDPGEHRISTGAGTIRLEIARDVDARIEVDHDRGPVEIDFPTRRQAAAVLRLASHNGSIHVHEGQASVMRPPTWTSHAVPRVASAPKGDRAGEGDQPAASNDEVERVLELVAAGKLSARAARELLAALARR